MRQEGVKRHVARGDLECRHQRFDRVRAGQIERRAEKHDPVAGGQGGQPGQLFRRELKPLELCEPPGLGGRHIRLGSKRLKLHGVGASVGRLAHHAFRQRHIPLVVVADLGHHQDSMLQVNRSNPHRCPHMEMACP